MSYQGILLKENKHSTKNALKSHYHEVYQILYVLENKAEITFNNERYSFSQDNLVFIPPYKNHSIISDAKTTTLVLEFDLEELDSDFKKLLKAHHLDEPRLIQLNRIVAANIRQLLRRMLYEQSQGKTINTLALKIYLQELLLTLIKTQQEFHIPDANVLRAERLRKYLDMHYFEIRDANDISKNVGISTRHINSIFKEQFDKTPMKYLNEVRMEIAKKLLIETDNDIASICFEVGFESLSTFYRRFKDYTNLSPNKYRMKYQYMEQSL